MKKYTVLMTEECETCQGQGKTHDDRWDIVYANLDDSPDADIVTEILKGWRVYHGYHCYRVKELPPEDFVCPECEGAGKIVKEVNLLDALADLGFNLGAMKQRIVDLEYATDNVVE